jgi:hypothetical protein
MQPAFTFLAFHPKAECCLIPRRDGGNLAGLLALELMTFPLTVRQQWFDSSEKLSSFFLTATGIAPEFHRLPF